MNIFERYLTVWVFICIVIGIALGQFFPDPFLTAQTLALYFLYALAVFV